MENKKVHNDNYIVKSHITMWSYANKEILQTHTGEIMSHKTPYELRAELLSLAYNICMEKHAASHRDKLFEINQQRVSEKIDIIPDQGNTTSPTTEEIIREAHKLNDFIQNKGS